MDDNGSYLGDYLQTFDVVLYYPYYTQPQNNADKCGRSVGDNDVRAYYPYYTQQQITWMTVQLSMFQNEGLLISA